MIEAEKIYQADNNNEKENQIVIDRDNLSVCKEKNIEIEVLNSEMKSQSILEEKKNEESQNYINDEVITLKEETINKKEEQKDTSTEEISSEEINQEKEENGEESKKEKIIIKLNQIEIKNKEKEKNEEINEIENNKEEEIHFENDVPLAAAINEAVELAKHYGTDNSGSFVNGVLARVASSKDKKDMADKQDTVDADEVRSSEGGADITEETIEEKAEAADC